MNIQKQIREKFRGQRRLRPWSVNHFGGMEAAKAHPLAICRFRPDEGGTVATNLNVTLAPVSGYMRSKAYAHAVQVFVPYQAIEKLELGDTQEDAGVTEMTRRRLMAGQGIGLESEGEITKAAYIHPRSVGGDGKVNKSARLAYIAAVNHLRRASYHAATLAPKTETAILPAVLTANVLERLGGVLEPETLIDGAINLTGELPVKGLGVRFPGATPNITGTETGGTSTGEGWKSSATLQDQNTQLVVEEDPANPGQPRIVAEMSGAGDITLRDMMKSKKLDAIVRDLAGMVKADPLHGEERVERAIYGISVEFDDDCHVLFDRVFELTAQHTRPMDGASMNDISGHFELNTRFGTIVPRSELGGQLVTLVMVKPLEVLSKQPDPAQTEPWELVNRVHDELELDEQLLTRQDLESGVSAINQDQEAFWVGHNALKHKYSTQGVNDQQVLGVEMQSSMWTYEVPTSVTPENVNYPASIDMYPFHHWNGAHAEYTIAQQAMISTPLALGPTPVERIQLFKDDPTLIEG